MCLLYVMINLNVQRRAKNEVQNYVWLEFIYGNLTVVLLKTIIIIIIYSMFFRIYNLFNYSITFLCIY